MRIDRGTLVNKMLKTCSVSYHMKDKETGFESFGEGTFKGIQIIAEKSNNKNITKIIGLETFIVPKSEAEEQIHGFANFLKEKFACSVNVGNLPGKNAGKEIVAHGNFINQLQDLFKEEHKIKQNYISTLNKLDKKKKR